MSKRDENRKHVRKRTSETELDTDYSGSEDDRSVRNTRRGFDESRGRPRYNRDYYNYSAYEDRYNGWRDLYRPDYYQNGYQSDYEWGYVPYRGRRDGDYYGDYGYGDDSDCLACNQRGGRRGGRMHMHDDPYLYRYEESRPRRRYDEGRSHRRSRRTSESPDTGRGRNRNDMNVYAVHDVVGESGFKDKGRKPEPESVKSGMMSESEKESRHRTRQRRERRREERRRPRRRRPEYFDDSDC